MSKILIISILFQPHNEIGAVRPTNFAKWLAEFGHQVDVITMNPKSTKLTHGNLKVFCVANGKYHSNFLKNTYNKTAEKKKHNFQTEVPSGKKNNKSPLRGLRTQLLNLLQSYDWKNQCMKNFSKIVSEEQYDIIFSSYGPIGSYWLGRALYKKKVAKYWVSDLRDLMLVEALPGWLKKYYGYFQKQTIREASVITVPSFGAANILREQFCKIEAQQNKVHVINNGYEFSTTGNKNNFVADDVLKICYTGALYAGQRDMSLLFEAISELITDGELESEKIEIHYAGGDSNELLSQSSLFDLKCIINHGFIPRSDAIKLQNSSDLMLVLSWNTQKDQGILTGKFFEYMAVDKPLISITRGDLPGAELTNMVRAMNLGIACEYISRQKDLTLLKEYILSCYQYKIKGQQIPFNPCKEMVEEYRYDNLTRKLEHLFLNLLKQ